MFKKATVQSQNKLRSTDVKRLKKDAQLLLPSLTEADIETIFPSKADVIVTKLNHRTLVYSVNNGNPLFFDPEGENDLYPTVYLLWAFPTCLPAVLTYSEVSPKVLGGADLMLPGFIVVPGAEGAWEAEDHMCCCVRDNSLPFAVGFMEQSSNAAAAAAWKGRGLKVLHHYPDQLWAMGDKSVPDPSFTPTRVYPTGGAPAAPATAAPPQPPPAAAEPLPVAAAAEAVVALSLGPAAGAASAAAGGGAGGAAASLFDSSTPDGMDAVLDAALLAAVAQIADSELPCQFEQFYSKHLLPARPLGQTADVKKSGYKKLAKLFAVWEKRGALATKAVHKQDCIVSVNRQHKDVVAAAAAAATAGDAGAAGAADGAADDGGAHGGAQGAGSAAGEAGAATIVVTETYRIPSSLRPLVGDAAAADKDRLFTSEEVGAAMLAYAGANGLLDAAPGAVGQRVKLDPLLLSLYNKKEREDAGGAADSAELLELLLSRLQLFTRLQVSRGGKREEVVKKGAVRNIHIQAEDRHAGRKFVTKVAGLEYFVIDPEEFSTAIQRKYNTSASVGDLPGKTETGKEVLVQGNLLAEIVAHLEKIYGIPQCHMDIVSKLK